MASITATLKPNPSATALRMLIGALKTWIDPSRTELSDLEPADWGEVMQLASASNTAFLMQDGLRRLDITAPRVVTDKITEMRTNVFLRNMTNIATIVRVCTILRTNGIEAVAIKGVPRSREIYGVWDARKSADADLLVANKDYREAIEVLNKNGFDAPISSHSRWWHDYLGESPHVPKQANSVIVDLHHKLAQPGTPAATNIDILIRNRRTLRFGKFDVHVLSELDSLMLAATSFGKAVRARQPWLLHAHEIACLCSRNDAIADREYSRYADEHGIGRLWQHAAKSADLLFRNDAADSAEFEELAKSAIGLSNSSPHPYARSQLLWRWTDGRSSRLTRFLSGLTRVQRSEKCHDREEWMEGG